MDDVLTLSIVQRCVNEIARFKHFIVKDFSQLCESSRRMMFMLGSCYSVAIVGCLRVISVSRSWLESHCSISVT